MESGELTVGEFLKYLAPAIWKDCPCWPGDLFALSAALLEKSSAYVELGMGVRPWLADGSPDDWQGQVILLAEESRRKLDTEAQQNLDSANLFNPSSCPLPDRIQESWRKVVAAANTTVSSVRDSPELISSLVELTAFCDECLAGVGIGWPATDATPDQIDAPNFWLFAERLLSPRSNPFRTSTLCLRIHPSRLRVLPKSQTPKSGLSLRSLSHHLALCPPIDIAANWHMQACVSELNETYCNILLVPWPFRIQPSQFKPVPLNDDDSESLPYNTGWFQYTPIETDLGKLISLVEELVLQARRDVGPVTLIVFPELALTLSQFETLKSKFVKDGIGLIAGVLTTSAGIWSENSVRFALPTMASPETSDDDALVIAQRKHHRWRLDLAQIQRYGLSSILDPRKEWWEGIEVNQREINFIRLRTWLTTCVLVCEDLARTDPVGRFVRAVAPDLVVALLMDGPQLKERWPAYHATVLADDPGSSVLTLTCLGMVKLSQPKDMIGKDTTPIIAMWRDPVFGVTEIPLPRDVEGVLLTITQHETAETSADGREHLMFLGAPVYGGVHYLTCSRR